MILRRLALLVLVVGVGASAPEAAGLEKLDWIVGTWKRETSRGATFETWRRLSDRTFEGEDYRMAQATGEKIVTETLLLAGMGEDVFYIPKVGENPYPVPFKLTSLEDREAVFENPDHDFPRKIVYARHEDGSMVVTIEGDVEGRDEPKRIEFHFTRVD